MRCVPFDLVANWQPEREDLLPYFIQELAALLAVVTFCGLITSVAILVV